MAWEDIATVYPGEVWTAAGQNSAVKNNSEFLYARRGYAHLVGLWDSNVGTQLGVGVQRVSGTNRQTFMWLVDDDFKTLEQAYWVYSPAASGTSDADVVVNYFNPSLNEAVDTHTASLVAAGEPVVVDKGYILDITGLFAELEIGDLAVVYIDEGGSGPQLYDYGFRFMWERT